MFRILVIASNIYADVFYKKFCDKSFYEVRVISKDELVLNVDFLFNYHAVVFQIDYPLFPETLSKIKRLRELFQGVLAVVDYYDYYKHRFFINTIKAELYYPLVNGFSELIQQCRYLLVSKFMVESGVVTYKDLSLNLSDRSCCRAGKLISLRNREFELLKFLLENPSRIFTVSQLLEAVWDMNSTLNTNTVQSHISFLRKKIDLGFNDKRLHTVPSVGYKLE